MPHPDLRRRDRGVRGPRRAETRVAVSTPARHGREAASARRFLRRRVPRRTRDSASWPVSDPGRTSPIPTCRTRRVARTSSRPRPGPSPARVTFRGLGPRATTRERPGVRRNPPGDEDDSPQPRPALGAACGRRRTTPAPPGATHHDAWRDESRFVARGGTGLHVSVVHAEVPNVGVSGEMPKPRFASVRPSASSFGARKLVAPFRVIAQRTPRVPSLASATRSGPSSISVWPAPIPIVVANQPCLARCS